MKGFKKTNKRIELKKLDLACNLIKDEGCALLCEALSNFKDLETLNLKDNCLDIASGAPILKLLETTKNLTKINLKLNRVSAFTAKEIEIVCHRHLL